MPTVMKQVVLEETEEELMNMTRDEVTINLNDKQKRFCEIYTRNFNIRLAAKQAGYAPKSAHTTGWKIRQDPECNRYIAWLKLQVAHECHISATDIIDLYARIAFADITDSVDIDKRGKLVVKNPDMLDGQIISSMKQTSHGIQIEMVDKLKALDKLERYFNVMPKDWKQKVEERKVELMEQKLELEKQKVGLYDIEDDDDGFIEALTQTAEEVWDTELKGGEGDVTKE